MSEPIGLGGEVKRFDGPNTRFLNYPFFAACRKYQFHCEGSRLRLHARTSQYSVLI